MNKPTGRLIPEDAILRSECSFSLCAPGHHSMTRLWVAGGGTGLQLWGVAANKLIKQPRTADMGWSFSFGVGRGTNNPSPLK
jgi:hypothetical protein